MSPSPIRIRNDGQDSGGAPSAKSDEGISEKTYDFSKKAIDISTERAISAVDRDMERARTRMSKNEFARYRNGAEDTKSVISGLGKLLTAADYAVGVKKIFDADPGKNTQYQTTKLAYQIGTDLAGQAAQKGIGAAARALLPNVAPYLAGPAGIALAVAQVTLSSEEIGKDPSEIIQDKSGKYSLEEKRTALRQSLKAYDQRGTSAISTEELLNDVGLVQEEQKIVEAKQNK